VSARLQLLRRECCRTRRGTDWILVNLTSRNLDNAPPLLPATLQMIRAPNGVSVLTFHLNMLEVRIDRRETHLNTYDVEVGLSGGVLDRGGPISCRPE
jgi:hypothetical protein